MCTCAKYPRVATVGRYYKQFCKFNSFTLIGAFEDDDVIHVDGDVNPVRDLETIGEELRLKDEEQLLQNLDKLDRVVNRGTDKKLKPEYVSITFH